MTSSRIPVSGSHGGWRRRYLAFARRNMNRRRNSRSMKGLGRSSLVERNLPDVSAIVWWGSRWELSSGAPSPGSMEISRSGVSTFNTPSVAASKAPFGKVASMLKTNSGERDTTRSWLCRLVCFQLKWGSMLPSIEAHDQVGARWLIARCVCWEGD